MPHLGSEGEIGASGSMRNLSIKVEFSSFQHLD
jgi:hypothetical protein